MTWIRWDDQLPIHRKVAPLSDAAFRLHAEAMAWCSRNGTDGIIRKAELELVSAKRGKPARAAELVANRLWHPAGQLCDRCTGQLANAGQDQPTDGWAIHDYLDFNPSAAKVAQERAAKSQRQARWLANRRTENPSTDASAPPSIDASKDDAPSRPVPSRPQNQGGDVGPPLTPGARTAPFPRCPKHQDRPADGPCGACADARRARDQWNAADADRRRTQAQCDKHRGHPAHNCGLCRSEALAADPTSEGADHG